MENNFKGLKRDHPLMIKKILSNQEVNDPKSKLEIVLSIIYSGRLISGRKLLDYFYFKLDECDNLDKKEIINEMISFLGGDENEILKYNRSRKIKQITEN
jgi:hypothetical protein